jgi:hypothetical protein
MKTTTTPAKPYTIQYRVAPKDWPTKFAVDSLWTKYHPGPRDGWRYPILGRDYADSIARRQFKNQTEPGEFEFRARPARMGARASARRNARRLPTSELV